MTLVVSLDGTVGASSSDPNELETPHSDVSVHAGFTGDCGPVVEGPPRCGYDNEFSPEGGLGSDSTTDSQSVPIDLPAGTSDLAADTTGQGSSARRRTEPGTPTTWRLACTASDDGSGLADPADASFTLATSRRQHGHEGRVLLDGGPIATPGHAFPNGEFRYLGGTYVLLLSTRGLAPGTHTLAFTASRDPATHTVQVVVRARPHARGR